MSDGIMLGQAACLTSAFCWALAIVLFRPSIDRYGAWAVNLVRMSIGSLLLGLTVLATGQGATLLETFQRGGLLIVASALLGLTLGDSALFAAVGRLGASRALLLMTLAPVFAAALAAVFQGERLPLATAVGGGVILLGVALVLTAPSAKSGGRFDGAGTALGALAAFGQAAGVVSAKAAMGTMPVLPASLARMLTALVGLLVVLAVSGHLRSAVRALRNPVALRAIAPPATIGTYLAFMLMMAGISLAPAAIAAVLLATTPIFSLFLEAKLFGGTITVRGFVGTLVAVLGVAVLTLSAS